MSHAPALRLPTTLFMSGLFLLSTAAGATPTGPPGAEVPTLSVEVLCGDNWIPAGELHFGRSPSELALPLPGTTAAAQRQVRISGPGDRTALLDAVFLGGHPALSSPDGRHALDLLAEPDLDLYPLAGGGSVTLAFPADADPVLQVVARIVPRTIPVAPFNFPLDNLYLNPKSFRSFYSYSLNRTDLSLTVDGNLDRESLGAPLVDEVTRPGSGHPTAATLIWLGNDEETLYAAVDFTPDNTDEAEDFATLFVRRPDGLRSFTISADDRRWGRRGFTPTRQAAYRHTVYELAVPLAELGISPTEAASGATLELAFSLYGTVAVVPLVDFFAAPTSGGQSVDASGCTLGQDDIPPPGSILGSERDMRVISGTPTADVNLTAAGRLTADFSSSAGSIELVYDGPDGDCDTLQSTTFVGDLVSPGYDRLVLVDVANPGTGPVDVTIRIVVPDPGLRAVTHQSVTRTVPAASGPVNLEFRYASDFPTLTDPSVLFNVHAVVLELAAATPGGVLTAEELVPSDGPVPVELQAFTISSIR